ncbi:MAG: hypothetical protein MJE68_01860, partial [Proteobacteria bacterium]|nr:hypothetical protein [Pseudomonadota bacterium]
MFTKTLMKTITKTANTLTKTTAFGVGVASVVIDTAKTSVFAAASVVVVGVGIVAASAFSSPAQAQPLATPHPPVVQLASISTHPAPGGT